ncbi:MAG: hypothetical protein Kow001_05330 [Acidobacteriota bacterium]
MDLRLRTVKGLVSFLRKSLERWPPLSPGIRWRAFIHGFLPRSAALYRLEESIGEYMPDFHRSLYSPRVNGSSDHIINNKAVFSLLMEALAIPAPRLFGWLQGGRWRPADPQGMAVAEAAEAMGALLEAEGKLVIKPVKGRKGIGLVFLSRCDGALQVNGRTLAGDQLSALANRPGRYIVTSFAEQAEYARGLYPRTTNTVRLLTLWDFGAGRPFLAAAAQRIGSSRSFPVDNFQGGRGGLSAEVGPGGELGRAACLSAAGKLTWHSCHPETGGAIEGVVIPRWTETVERILVAAARMPFAPGLAWDVVWTADSFQVLELNGAPGLFLHQVHRPLLQDPRIRDFYRQCGVIR